MLQLIGYATLVKRLQEDVMEEKTVEKKKPRISSTAKAFIIAVIVGTLIGFFIVSNSASKSYKASLKNELTSFRGDTNLIDKSYSDNEAEAFKQMKIVVADYSKNAPEVKTVLLGSILSGSYRNAQDLNAEYRAVLTEYQQMVDEYFTKVTKIRTSETMTEAKKKYVNDYVKRLEAVKEKRRQLEEKLK